jgi:hypothetical protein
VGVVGKQIGDRRGNLPSSLATNRRAMGVDVKVAQETFATREQSDGAGHL